MPTIKIHKNPPADAKREADPPPAPEVYELRCRATELTANENFDEAAAVIRRIQRIRQLSQPI